ncbi:ribosome recycling factor [Planctomyces sp. SH-PL14]|uniref:ribosome recycling factor n=1 Tax=Planctomyces sp. SH-PL14 TaxID=1632864 RepID=UPI00078E75F6|nr:ribosome recycling factor [Planctomyces sp. SH-PL14]AMV21355.1 Ribosome-recycling factor [Planctomyces sp. SH-PL14]
MTLEEILFDAEERMDKATDVYRTQLQGLRTGRATPGLVDSIKVEVYGTWTPLKHIANISCPEPQQIVIRPFNAAQLQDIVKGIQSSDAGMAPMSDGRMVRINVPALSGERRKELIQRVHKMAEEARVAIRNIRRDANKAVETAEKEKTMTEDEAKDGKEQVQELTKTYETKVNGFATDKEKELNE